MKPQFPILKTGVIIVPILRTPRMKWNGPCPALSEMTTTWKNLKYVDCTHPEDGDTDLVFV